MGEIVDMSLPSDKVSVSAHDNVHSPVHHNHLSKTGRHHPTTPLRFQCFVLNDVQGPSRNAERPTFEPFSLMLNASCTGPPITNGCVNISR